MVSLVTSPRSLVSSQRHAMVIGAGQLGRGGEQQAIPLADADAFEGEQRTLQ